MAADVEFWFDSVCPCPGITSRWVHEVQGARDLNLTWSVTSLAVLNEGNDVLLQYAQAMVAADSDSLNIQLRVSHHRGISLVDAQVGAPVIAVSDPQREPVAIFGPVITPMPIGSDVLKMWDGTFLVASVPGLSELKRTRTADPSFD